MSGPKADSGITLKFLKVDINVGCRKRRLEEKLKEIEMN